MVVKVNNLNKYYDKIHALKNVSFDIAGNGLYLLAGPNGSGKSTLMEILTRMISSDSGTVEYSSISESDFSKKVGILFQQNGVRKNITVREELIFVSKLFNQNIVIEDHLEKFGLLEHQNKKSQKLSGGLKRKLLISLLFIPDYDVIFFDEPASGLDVQTRDFIWSIIKDYSSTKICIVSDHYLDQASNYCDYILLLLNGELLFQGSKDSLISEFKYKFRIQVNSNISEEIALQLDSLDVGYETLSSGIFTNFYIKYIDSELKQKFSDNQIDIRKVSVEDVYMYLSEKKGTING